MTPLAAIATCVAALLVGGVALLWLLGESRTLLGTGGECWMCRYYLEYYTRRPPGACIKPENYGYCRWPDQYACGWYRRKWWLLWCSREAPGSGG